MGTLNQLLVQNAIRHQFDLQRYSSQVVADVVALLNAADSDLRDKIAARLAVERDASQLEALLADIRELNTAAVGAAGRSMSGRLSRFAGVEEDLQAAIYEKPLAQALGYTFRFSRVDPDMIAGIAQSRPWEGRLLSKHFSNIAARRQAALIKTIRTGMTQGEPTEKIVSAVMGKRGRGGLYTGGVLDDSRKDVRSLVRSYTAVVANEVRNDLLQANADVVKAVMWISTLDDGTTEWCQVRDGLTYTLDHEPIDHDFPWGDGPGASHWQCRSTSVAVLAAADDLPIDWERIGEDGNRAAVNRDDAGEFINGEVPSTVDYTDWLREQPRSVQNDVLGNERANWFRDNEDASVGEAWAQSFAVRQDDRMTLRDYSNSDEALAAE